MEITVGRQGAAPARRHRQVPWSPYVWGQVLYLAGGIPVQAIGALVILGLVSGSRAAIPNGALITLLWLAGLAGMLALSPVLTGVQRHRLRTTAGVDIPRSLRRRNWLSPRAGIAAMLRSQSTWRRLGYHLVAGPVLAAAAIVAVALWPGILLVALLPFLAWSDGHPVIVGYASVGTPLAHHPLDILLVLAGLAGLLAAAPWVTSAVRAADSRAGQALLGPSRAELLANRVAQLTETRAGVVDAADAERRRLERDLHDGTQQRLVSLAMNLGLARAQAGTVHEARLAIAAAHEEAKAALAELRDLIRGLHPAVLEDRGLDAALSGVAARMPVPVRLTVDLPRRPAPVIEAVAYFMVSEGLSNIVKHAQATEVAVFVQRAGDRLHVIVTDDGVGGADPARGTGLAGLARRAASVDGTFEIDSPLGGPTLLTVDLPCNR